MSNATALPEQIRFGRAVCGDIDQAERREWWLANGTGGYASGTISGTLTRVYHGLLIAPVHPPMGRVLVAAKADATLHIEEAAGGKRQFALFANRWKGGDIDPQGYLHLESFSLEGRMPVWRFRVEAHRLEMRIWMEPGANTSYVAYRLESTQAVTGSLRVALLVNARDHHATAREGEFAFQVSTNEGCLKIAQGENFVLEVGSDGIFSPEGIWYENFDLPEESRRGLADCDNHFCAGHADIGLKQGEWSGLVFSVNGYARTDFVAALKRFRDHDIAKLDAAADLTNHAPDWIKQLVLAADSFVIARPLTDMPDGQSVIAGYPWFGDWGRDTMVSLPGLCLATGRLDAARRILMTFSRFIDQGQLPNVFPGSGERPEYNTVDAALWFIEAWRAYVEVSGDLHSLRQCWPSLDSIVQWYLRGTRYGIGVDDKDGLLRAGAPGMQLTWMDAKVGDWVVTPRTGKQVEINALWFNALAAMTEMGASIAIPVEDYQRHASRAREGFQRFINPSNGGLYDVLDGPDGQTDKSVRPNQIFAVSLRYSPLEVETQRSVVALCGRDLLTSYGLRSLSPLHPAYHPYYRGDVRARDGSYHQGTVWPWLLGHFALAEFHVTGDAEASRSRLRPLGDHLLDAGLGTVSEILDAAEPHIPGGAPAQAWSVACTLEAWWRLQRAQSSERAK